MWIWYTNMCVRRVDVVAEQENFREMRSLLSGYCPKPTWMHSPLNIFISFVWKGVSWTESAPPKVQQLIERIVCNWILAKIFRVDR